MESETILYLDNSKRRMFSDCPRKYYWQAEKGIVSKIGSSALRYGSTWHACLEAYYEFVKDHGWEDKAEAINAGVLAAKKEWDKRSSEQQFLDDYRNLENLYQCFLDYILFFRSDEQFLKIIGTEKIFKLPIYPWLTLTGRLDAQAELDGMKWIIENKTTSMYLNNVMQTLHRSPQLLTYFYAAGEVLDFQPVGCIVNVHQVSSRKTKDGSWGKLTVDFARNLESFTQGDVGSWLEGFIWIASQIKICKGLDRWPMNHDSCYTYGPCTYVGLCEQNREPEDTNLNGYIHLPWDVLDSNE